MLRIIAVAAICSSLTTAALAESAPPYAAPPPTGDAKSTIICGLLMSVNGIIMSEADRRHQECATFVHGLDRNGFPIFREHCRLPREYDQN